MTGPPGRSVASPGPSFDSGGSGRIIHGFARTLAVSFILTTWRLVRGNGRGQARIIVEVEARACPLRQVQKTHGGVGVLPYLPPK